MVGRCPVESLCYVVVGLPVIGSSLLPNPNPAPNLVQDKKLEDEWASTSSECCDLVVLAFLGVSRSRHAETDTGRCHSDLWPCRRNPTLQCAEGPVSDARLYNQDMLAVLLPLALQDQVTNLQLRLPYCFHGGY